MNKKILASILLAVGAFLVGMYGVALWVDQEPETVDIADIKKHYPRNNEIVKGYITAETMVRGIDKILNKNGGYIRNDIMPPFSLLDNMPAYEIGYLKVIREGAFVLRDKMSKVEFEDANLSKAQPAIVYSANTWGLAFMANTEDQYEISLKHFIMYRDSLVDADTTKGQFVPRANDLKVVMDKLVEQLKSQATNLKSSTGVNIANVDANSDSAKKQDVTYYQKAPFMLIDDNFYEARGAVAASLDLMLALREDFSGVLKDKNATVHFNQAISWLELAYEDYNWPMVLPGDHYGLLGNHSGDLSSDINSTVVNLIRVGDLLTDG